MLEIQYRFKQRPEMLAYIGTTIEQIKTDFKCYKQLKTFTGNLDRDSSKTFFELLKCARPKNTVYCHMWFNGIIFVAQGRVSVSAPEKPERSYEAGSIVGIENFFKRKPLSFWKVSPVEPNTILYVLERSALEDALETAAESSIAIYKLLLNEMLKLLLPLSELQHSSFDKTSPLAPIIFLLEGYSYVDPSNAGNVVRSYYEILPNALAGSVKSRAIGERSPTAASSGLREQPLQALPVLLSKYEEENALKKAVEESKGQQKRFKSAFLEANLIKQGAQKIESEAEEAAKRNTLILDEYEKLQEDKEELQQEYDELVVELEAAKNELEEIKAKEKREMEIKEQLQTKKRKADLVKEINSNARVLRAGEFFNKQVRFKAQSRNLANTVRNG
eukprot:TRINITY_DN4053_c0_g1_i1.p1 TRINITY_DN4053_c0_g1~~TRINITY_DN4053_c0_g1_i1.p1  ORF type:complete len:390 (-),score=95.21 TRINITY_DN4053_c0_g1_i1:243-1412(-)